MKLHLASDIHLEHWYVRGSRGHLRMIEKIPECDVLVLAGDILSLHVFSDLEHEDIWESFAGKAKLVVYVPGNHEYYGSSVEVGRNVLKMMAQGFPANVKLLGADPRQIVEFEGRRILGDTLWFGDDPDNHLYEKFLSDFNVIRGFKPWVYEEHGTTRGFLARNVKKGDIVVTHHLPSDKSVPRKYKNSGLNRFFVAPCDDIIEATEPALWLHGHTHGACDYKVGETRVLCNPMGYPGEKSEYTTLVVEVPGG